MITRNIHPLYITTRGFYIRIRTFCSMIIDFHFHSAKIHILGQWGVFWMLCDAVGTFRHTMIRFLSIAIRRLSGVAFCIGGGRNVSPRDDRVSFFYHKARY